MADHNTLRGAGEYPHWKLDNLMADLTDQWIDDDGNVDDTGWLTSGITAATGWSISSQRYRRIGQVVEVLVAVKRTGAAITVSATGDVSDTAVCTVPTGFTTSGAHGLHSQGGRVAAYALLTNGIIYITACAPGGNIATGEALTIAGTYLLG